LTMAALNKMFVCRSLDLTPAQTVYDQRIYMYASFLLTYNVASSEASADEHLVERGHRQL